jgi:NADH dehydrogenase [ubiquinone] 1 alpha subcomplex assembly factor 7
MSHDGRGGLSQRIARLINATGPISLAEYMHMAMADPVEGYYARREAIGADADFVTAPEVSQMFGELVGVWCAGAWQALGSPRRFILAEAGPGRGTLMADLLRAGAKAPGFLDAAEIRLIETSAAMRRRQSDRLAAHAQRLGWVDRLEDVETGPLILVANEFLDALPVRQFVKAGTTWRERSIGIGSDGGFISMLGTALAEQGILPAGSPSEPEGSVFEWAPAREAWAETLSHRIQNAGGAALLIDYGHARSGFGDTFQAVRGHARADPFDEPGMADLTSHVDFEAITAAIARGGAMPSQMLTQGDFLLAMGLLERASTLGTPLGETGREAIRVAVERLAAPSQMGRLFKVVAMAAKQNASAMIRVPPFADGHHGTAAPGRD